MKLNAKMLLTALTILLLVATLSTSVFANTDSSTSLIDKIKSGAESASIESEDMTTTAGKVLKLIRTIAIILGTIVIAVLGVKYMMGSVEEKAEYKKSFIPLVVGILVIMAATSIATLLFSTFS